MKYELDNKICHNCNNFHYDGFSCGRYMASEEWHAELADLEEARKKEIVFNALEIALPDPAIHFRGVGLYWARYATEAEINASGLDKSYNKNYFKCFRSSASPIDKESIERIINGIGYEGERREHDGRFLDSPYYVYKLTWKELRSIELPKEFFYPIKYIHPRYVVANNS